MSDLIYREDAVKALRLEYPMMTLFKAMREEWALRTEGFRRAEEVIMRLPSAERKGEWKRRIVDNGWNADFICSECGYTIMIEDTYPYCPNCGADMRGAEDE